LIGAASCDGNVMSGYSRMTDQQEEEEFTGIRRGYVYRLVEGSCCSCFSDTWQLNYCLLKDGCLFFYSKAESIKPLYQLSLYGAACVFLQYPKTTKPNCIEISTPTDTLQLYTDSTQEIKDWALKIQQAALIASGGKKSQQHGGNQENSALIRGRQI
jgi:hypothetical protein